MMNPDIDFNKQNLHPRESEGVFTPELVANLLLTLKNMPKFNTSFVLSMPYNFNFQTSIAGVSKSSYGAILSFLKTADSAYVVLNNKLEQNTDMLLNILIEKTHLNIMGEIRQIYPTNFEYIYIAEINFKNLSTQDKANIAHIIENKKDLSSIAEKREHLRFQKNIPITYQVYTNTNVLNEHAAVLYTIDISQGGVRVASADELLPNNMLYMQIPFKNKTIYCAGKVIWANYSTGINKYLAGIKFIDLSEEVKENLLELVLG